MSLDMVDYDLLKEILAELRTISKELIEIKIQQENANDWRKERGFPQMGDKFEGKTIRQEKGESVGDFLDRREALCSEHYRSSK